MPTEAEHEAHNELCDRISQVLDGKSYTECLEALASVAARLSFETEDSTMGMEFISLFIGNYTAEVDDPQHTLEVRPEEKPS